MSRHRRSRWEHLPHGADIGVRGRGPSLDEAFEQAGLALTALVTEPNGVAADQEVAISCTAPDAELLLVEWLNALIFEMATRHLLFGRFDVRIRDGALRGTAWGEAVDVKRHAPAVEPKGATYTGLRVARRPSGEWVAECVVDV